MNERFKYAKVLKEKRKRAEPSKSGKRGDRREGDGKHHDPLPLYHHERIWIGELSFYLALNAIEVKWYGSIFPMLLFGLI